METAKSLGSMTEKLGQILVISLLLAASVGIGSVLTQYQLKLPIDWTMTGMLMIIFGFIVGFGGIVFTLALKR